jgi:DNA processing protein
MLAVSAQSIATGKSRELAQEEKIRIAGAGASVLTLDDPAYPAQLRQIYDPPPTFIVRE